MLRSLILGCLLLISASSLTAQHRQLNRLVNYLVETEVDFDKTPGLVIGVIEGEAIHVYGFGETARGNNQRPDSNTVFEIGSVSKVFTASLLAKYVQEGTMHYSDSLRAYLDAQTSQLNPSVSAFSLLSLANHTSGLPRVPSNLGRQEKNPDDPYAYYSRANLWAFLTNYTPTMPAGNQYHYSHLGYALLTEVLEQHAKQSYPDQLNQHLFRTLAMQDTRVQLASAQASRLAQGYSVVGNPVPSWNADSFDGALGLKSTLSDLLKFMNMNLGNTHSTLGEMMHPLYEEQIETDIPKVSAGIGWHLFKPRKKRWYTVITHSGVTNGHRIYMGFVRETKTGVIVLSNSRNNLNGLGGYLLKSLNYNWRKRPDHEH